MIQMQIRTIRKEIQTIQMKIALSATVRVIGLGLGTSPLTGNGIQTLTIQMNIDYG